LNVIMIAPGYPPEMPYFVRGFALNGGRVYGVGDQPEHDIPALARQHLSAYLRVPNLVDEGAVVDAIKRWTAPITVDRVICLWEPGVLLAARTREALGVKGMSVEQANWFRDKDVMKDQVKRAGIRVPKHMSARTFADVRKAAEHVGYPLIIKPIAGAGSMDTFRVDSAEELDAAVLKVSSYDQVNIEEFIDGEEFTFDTVCSNGKVHFWNIGYYRPRPLIARSVEWISPQTLCLRDVEHERLKGGVEMGFEVLKALEFDTGFTHMEWYLKPNGETVFGEIAARPAGANTVDLMNYVCDTDLFVGYPEAELKGTFSQPTKRLYNSVNIFKRAQGQGTIRHIEGLERLKQDFGQWIVNVDLLPVGAQRRNWIQTLLSDGFVTLRHPDLQTAMDMADRVGTDLQLYAS
jgi:hypothetical protein